MLDLIRNLKRVKSLRIVLTNFGSTGSVFPYLALAVELQRRGHRAVLALPPEFVSWVAKYGIEFKPIGPSLRKEQNHINEAMVAFADSAASIRSLFSPIGSALPQMYEDLRDSCSNADVLVSGPVQPAGMMVHEKTGIPLVTVQNVHFASGGSPGFQQAIAEMINPVRERLGLRAVHNPIIDANRADLVLFAMSRYVRPPKLDWPRHYHMTGYFFLDEKWEPDASLASFLARGEKPVVISFGSMTHDDPDRITRLILEATQKAKCRTIIQQGWSGLAQMKLPESVFAVDYVPHSWLFRHARMIVHHGGSGTTAAVFRAGVPSVFVPHAWDQPVWADLGRELGCSLDAIPFPELTADRLGEAISRTMSDSASSHAAARLGDNIRSEAGVRRARILIEELAGNIGLAAGE